MRILFSITNLLVGGAQTFLVALANEISKTNKVYIYCFSESQITQEIRSRISPRVKLLTFPLILKIFIPYLQKIYSIFKINKRAIFTLKKLHIKFLVKSRHIHIIHSQLFHSDEFITYIFRDKQIPIITTEHGCYNFVVQEGFTQKNTITRIFKRVNGVAYISEQNRKNIVQLTGNEKIPFKKMKNGIPPVDFDPVNSRKLRESLDINSSDFVFGMVARGIKEKGWEIAIEAFKQLQMENPKPLYLILIGGSDYLLELKRQTESSVAHIHFLGSITHPLFWMQCFDVGLLPSYFAGESVPMTVIEGLACGKPVIATDVGEIKDMIQCGPELAGILFEYSDDFNENVRRLKQAMQTYLDEPGLLEKQREIARECFKNYHIETVARQYYDIYSFYLNQ